ncbi:hypothetical protein [Natrinema hispanicum]|uniref:DUF7312 domain-containing protein n=1 Tax=Natrinema hispanicum TaxID=392421 RepID=A0A1G6SSG1_9EURY|nr:hypothetical protein [Natrinema hispanicum]SDD19792.1 hypothetical protein SAMN05192552_10159 [Natrinema hispanicum]SET90259.1 hypothetical protein SAMN04488694_1169 [Natrinema hispanicum]
MVSEPSGPGDDAADRWNESSTANQDSGPASDSSPADRVERANDDRIPLDLSGSDDDDAAATESNGYTPEASSTPIEPGDPDLENALFVLLGAIMMVLVIARLLMLPLG